LARPSDGSSVAKRVASLEVKDYFQVGKRSVLRFSEKGGKEKEIPVHHRLEAILDRYLDASGLRDRPDSPLFLAARGKTRERNEETKKDDWHKDRRELVHRILVLIGKQPTVSKYLRMRSSAA
jgi:site-specific recombinase XerC